MFGDFGCFSFQGAKNTTTLGQGGVLTGKYLAGAPAPADSRALEKPEWTMKLDESLFATLEAEAKARGRTLDPHALQGLLEQPRVVSLILGVKRQQQLEDALNAID